MKTMMMMMMKTPHPLGSHLLSLASQVKHHFLNLRLRRERKISLKKKQQQHLATTVLLNCYFLLLFLDQALPVRALQQRN